MPAEEKNTEWVTVHTFEGDITAEMLGGALENANIPNEVVRSMLSSGLGAHSISLAGNTAQIKVPAEYADQARRIIEDITKKK